MCELGSLLALNYRAPWEWFVENRNVSVPVLKLVLIVLAVAFTWGQLGFVFRQMRQRALSTSLTLLSIVLGVALAVSIIIFQREGEKFFGQTDFGYDLIVGAKGNDLTLVLNTVYQTSVSQGNIPYSIYEELSKNRMMVRWAMPYAVGDEYQGYRVVGTLDRILPQDHAGKPFSQNAYFEYRKDKPYELMSGGRNFHPEKFEAVIGSEVAEKTGLGIGSKFKVSHGAGTKAAHDDVHDEQWTVVGIMKPTRTASDRVIYIPLISFYAIPDHGKYLDQAAALEAAWRESRGEAPATRPAAEPAKPATEPATKPADGEHDEHAGHDHSHNYHLHGDRIHLELPKEKWKLSAVLVQTRGAFQSMTLRWAFQNRPDAMAVNPAEVMRNFFREFLTPFTRLLLAISILVTVVAAVSILVSIYNAVIARRREIAILRALGATRGRVLLIICQEAGVIGLVGALGGLVAGHLLGMGVSGYMERQFGQGINYLSTNWLEWVYLGAVTVLAILAGLVPALKAYTTPVATNLVAQ
jgi:putative ABC transport system permease protein